MPPKRKRAGSKLDADEPNNTTSSPVQASSRDASAEATTSDPTVDDGAENAPSAKRTRNTRATSINGSSGSRPTTAHKAEMPANGAAVGGGENGEAGKMRMEAPPPAGSIDPVGYKTNAPPKDRAVRVYADGVFDMFHLGHMRVLQQAKTAFPDTYLIVGVTGDAETHKRKGLTVMSAKERAESLRHCRWVDEVIEDCPWIINMDFLSEHAIDFVAHDDIPYGANEGDDIYKPIKEQGMFLVTQRTEGVSTTGIITKIVRDYEKYISRQFERGTSRQELNVSWLKKNELDIKRHVNELRDTIRTNWTTTGQELSKEFRQFWQPSRPNSPAPSLRNGGTPSRTSLLPDGAKSPNALFERVSSRSGTPGRERGRNMDFAAGYAMGLIGGVKGWMEGSKRTNLSDSRAPSPGGSEDDGKSPSGSVGRGRKMDSSDEGDSGRDAGKQLNDELDG